VPFGKRRRRWHPLGGPAALNAVVDEVLGAVGRAVGTATPTVRNLVVAGHSRAHDLLEPLAAGRGEVAMRQGALARLSEVWAFDTTYAGDVAAWTDWLAQRPSLRVSMFYRPEGKTGRVGNRFFARRGDRLAVTKVSESHCAVPARRMPDLLAPAVPPPTGQEDLA